MSKTVVTLAYVREQLRAELIHRIKLMRTYHHAYLRALREGHENATYYLGVVYEARRIAEVIYDLYQDAMGRGRFCHAARRHARDARMIARLKEGR